MTAAEDARDRTFDLIDRMIGDKDYLEQAIGDATEDLPANVVHDLDTVLAGSRVSYRDGIIIQFGYGLFDRGWDLTERPTGSRKLASEIGTFFSSRHITAVKDAYQNIAKNSSALARGNFAEFDRLLIWGNEATQEEREAVHLYACGVVAATARPVLPMPELNRSALTFTKTVRLLLDLVDTPSRGAYDQFTVAALMGTLVGESGKNAPRVETKNLNASDKSSRAAGDVQVVAGSRVMEAFEVTANDWSTKIEGASKTIRDNDLSRLHILAHRDDGARAEVLSRLDELAEDVSVLDTRQTIEVLTATLTRPQRADALLRLYQCLDRFQPDTAKVNTYVEKLRTAGLVESSDD